MNYLPGTLIALAIVLCAGLFGHSETLAENEEFELELSDSNYGAWRDHILPAKSELGYDKIPWLLTFKDGILEADKLQRPLLLWTMNGHPLGCT